MDPQIIPLQPIPNQEITFVLEGVRWAVTVKAAGANGNVVVSFDRNGVPVIQGTRAMSGVPLIPYEYLERGAGNFMLTTLNDDVPSWQEFGTTCQLVWTSAAELEGYRHGVR